MPIGSAKPLFSKELLDLVSDSAEGLENAAGSVWVFNDMVT